MDQNVNEAAKTLAKLAEGADGKSETAKLRAVIDQIEVALAAGVRRAAILETLRPTLGINMSLNTFQRSLYRIRKERRKKEEQQAHAVAQTSVTGFQPPMAMGLPMPADSSSGLPVSVATAPVPANHAGKSRDRILKEDVLRKVAEFEKSLGLFDYYDEDEEKI